jgi:hypothetical protein
MDYRLLELGQKEARKWFDPIRYLLVVKALNEYLGIVPARLK